VAYDPMAGPGGWAPPKGGTGGWAPPKGGTGGWAPPEEEAAGSGGVAPGASAPLVPAVNPAWLAASADRERAVSVLRAGFAEGRLSQDELDDRVARTYAARTYAQLWALTADLPAGPLPYPQFLPAAPYPQGPYSQGPGAVVPPGVAPDSTWRPAATLVITALVIFTLAALITALITVHTQAVVTPFQPGVHLEPYITYQPGP
jgi:Domain of unknown function (DUF1707)